MREQLHSPLLHTSPFNGTHLLSQELEHTNVHHRLEAVEVFRRELTEGYLDTLLKPRGRILLSVWVRSSQIPKTDFPFGRLITIYALEETSHVHSW